MNNKEELVKKIKALADSGVGGEKKNAQKLLQELMTKYNISEESLNEEIINEFELKIPKFFNSQALASQVYYSIVGSEIEGNKPMFSYRGSKKTYVKCTTAEFLELKAKLNFYFYYFKKEAEMFYEAFLQANKIFPPDSKVIEKHREDRALTVEDLKMLELAKNLDKHDYLLQIEGSGGAK